MTQYDTNPETHKSFVESKIVWMVGFVFLPWLGVTVVSAC
jgi:hypothetical protein